MRNLTIAPCGALSLSLLSLLAPCPARAQEAPPPPPVTPGVPVTPGAPGGPTAQADAAKTYTLVARYHVGVFERYRMQMAGRMEMTSATGQSPFPGGEFAITMNMRMKTVGVKPDGSAVVAVRDEGGEANFMGTARPIPTTPGYFMEVDRLGRAKMRGLEKTPGMDALSKIFDVNQMASFGGTLPDHPVKIGDTWETTIPMAGGQAMKVVNTLLGAERIGGEDTIRVGQTAIMPLALGIGADGKLTNDAANAMMTMRGSAAITGVANLATDNAHLLRLASSVKATMEMKLKGDAAQGSPFGGTMTMKMDEKLTMTRTAAGTIPVAPAAKK